MGLPANMAHDFASDHDPSAWAKAATLVAVSVATGLALAKGVAWHISGSAAVLGSFADSLLDVMASGIAFAGVRYAAQPADDNHRFGHTKAEAVSSLVQLVLISGSAVFVLVESLRGLLSPEALRATGLAMWVMAGSTVASIGLVGFQTYALRRAESLVTEGDRAHYVGDIVGNLGTLAALLVATRLQMWWLDAVAGIVAAGFLGWSVFEIARRALPQLMDEELNDDERENILRIARADPDVRGVHALRTRRAGATRYIQMHLELDPQLNLLDAHRISDRVEASLHAEFPDCDVILHQDPHGVAEAHDSFGRGPSESVSVVDEDDETPSRAADNKGAAPSPAKPDPHVA